MAKINLGDIFGIETAKGTAYLHFIYKRKNLGELVRVLSGVHSEPPVSFKELANAQEQFMVFFPLSAAFRRKIVERVGNYPIDGFEKPQFMRTKHYIGREYKGWHIVDIETWQRQKVSTLTPELARLSPWGIWNDTELIEKLDKGWSIDNWL